MYGKEYLFSSPNQEALIVPRLFRALSHDPEKYKSPETFHPDRHFDDYGKLLSGDDIYGYGFGRR